MQNHHKEILLSLSFIKINAIIKSIFESNGIFTVQGTKDNKLKRARLFYLNNKEYVLLVWPNGRVFNNGEIDKFLQARRKEGRVFLLILSSGLIPNVQEFYMNHFGNLIVVEYDNEAVLRKRLNSVIDDLLKAI
jgi:hypothetical protein